MLAHQNEISVANGFQYANEVWGSFAPFFLSSSVIPVVPLDVCIWPNLLPIVVVHLSVPVPVDVCIWPNLLPIVVVHLSVPVPVDVCIWPNLIPTVVTQLSVPVSGCPVGLDGIFAAADMLPVKITLLTVWNSGLHKTFSRVLSRQIETCALFSDLTTFHTFALCLIFTISLTNLLALFVSSSAKVISECFHNRAQVIDLKLVILTLESKLARSAANAESWKVQNQKTIQIQEEKLQAAYFDVLDLCESLEILAEMEEESFYRFYFATGRDYNDPVAVAERNARERGIVLESRAARKKEEKEEKELQKHYDYLQTRSTLSTIEQTAHDSNWNSLIYATNSPAAIYRWINGWHLDVTRSEF
ncbi:hypothetical protein BCR33DRAFT_788845 [Rhizoclosmatium globosum]|uniref:Uncharacterized protein n=1 Tax=Rhizoclosmatium globosum TaxID=329046 RepID=A0A1Y2BVG4_9FUNG|nr:hypothetical protein BCR33DRAFT_788845 [Rhizoclosmatium globosum]|eukprot:ORY38617.1 hypothetical protein BCR33DRAFT_788845 [Rhizoclosmatium globosum]